MAQRSQIILFPLRVAPGSGAVTTITASGNSMEYPEFASWEDAIIHIDVSAFTGTSLQFQIQERDETTGVWQTLTGTAPYPTIASITATGHARYVIGRSVNAPFGSRLRLLWTFVGTTCTVTVAAIVYAPGDPVPTVP